LPNDDFRRVSADTKTCGSPRNPSPAGGLRLPAGKHAGILTVCQAKDNKQTAQKALFSVTNSKFPVRYSLFLVCFVIQSVNSLFFMHDFCFGQS